MATKQPAAAPMENAEALAPAAELKKKRNLMTETLDMSISNARCQSHMKVCFVPASTEAELTEKRVALRAAKGAARAAGRSFDDDADIAVLKEEIDAITEQVVRIGGDAPIAMAAFADSITKECLKHAMDQTIAAGHKIVEIAALHSGGLSSIPVWPLICDLDAIKAYDPEHEAVLRQERAVVNKAQKAAREAVKKAREVGEAGADDGDDDDNDEDHHGPTTTFHTYVDNATKVVKTEAAYGAMRVSQRLREVVSDVVAEFVARFSKVAKVNVLELLGVRTLNAGHLLAIAKSVFVLKSGCEEDAGAQAVLSYAAEKVKLYHDYLEAEKTRKWGGMDPVRKAELEAKKAAVAEAKKKRDAENAKKKAVETA